MVTSRGTDAPGNRDKGARVPSAVAPIRRSDVPGVWTDGERLLTENLVPGVAVYGERLVAEGGAEYRAWNPRRSKLAALLRKGVGTFPFGRKTDVLYLGAAQGTTVSHLSDICVDGTIYAVEISRRAFQKLLALAERRHNVMPILGDAEAPEGYERLLARVDALYQDVAQRDQVGIFVKNLRFLRAGGLGLLMVKARSTDVAAQPARVYAAARKGLEAAGLDVLQVVPLDPYEADHAAFLVEKARPDG